MENNKSEREKVQAVLDEAGINLEGTLAKVFPSDREYYTVNQLRERKGKRFVFVLKRRGAHRNSEFKRRIVFGTLDDVVPSVYRGSEDIVNVQVGGGGYYNPLRKNEHTYPSISRGSIGTIYGLFVRNGNGSA
jgi:hypothetical protein